MANVTPSGAGVTGPTVTVGGTVVANGTNGYLLYNNNGVLGNVAAGSVTVSLAVGTTPITGGAAGRILYDNAGALGEMTTTGSGTQVALSDNPTFITAVTIPSVAWASIPAAGAAGKIVRVSDVGAKGSLWMDDGTRWKPVNGQVLLATLDTTSSSIANTETIVFQYRLPAALLQVGDRLRMVFSATKSGNTDTGIYGVRVGTAGTVGGDTSIGGSTIMSASQLNGGYVFDYRVVSATSTQLLGRVDLGYGGATTSSIPSPVSITNISNSLFVELTIRSNSTNNTVNVQDAQLYLIPSAN